LDIYTPASSAPKPWPVLVFFHGGNYRQGSISTVLYDGSYMAKRGNAIIVTAAYRLGALGWLAVGNNVKGNFGLYDQRLALQWVRDNIAAFGGDATSVTIFGQSAGATSIAVHLTTAMSKTLFDKAIVQSDPLQLPLRSMKDANDNGKVFTKTLGCNDNDVACMRSKPISDVLVAAAAASKYLNFHKPLQIFYPWTPVSSYFCFSIARRSVDRCTKSELLTLTYCVSLNS
jgi:carboxylesterase type B